MPDDITTHIVNIHTSVIDVLKGLRDFIHELRPGLLDQIGLIPALENFTEEINAEGNITINFKVSGNEKRILPEVELIIFRITREAIRNIIKHSQATEAFISIHFSTNKIRLRISDKGVGFNFDGNVSQFTNAGKLGLIDMQERTRLVKGNFQIKSAVNKGTTINVEIPVNT